MGSSSQNTNGLMNNEQFYRVEDYDFTAFPFSCPLTQEEQVQASQQAEEFGRDFGEFVDNHHLALAAHDAERPQLLQPQAPVQQLHTESRPTPRQRRQQSRSSRALRSSAPRVGKTPEQKQILEEAFAKCQYPTVGDREELAKKCGLSDSQIRLWFQYKRNKSKAAKAAEASAEAAKAAEASAEAAEVAEASDDATHTTSSSLNDPYGIREQDSGFDDSGSISIKIEPKTG